MLSLKNLRLACFAVIAATTPDASAQDETFRNPERVQIKGYSGNAMDPFVAPDGRTLLFSSQRGDKAGQLHHAKRVDDVTFRYVGPVLHGKAAVHGAGPFVGPAGSFYFSISSKESSSKSPAFQSTLLKGQISARKQIRAIDTEPAVRKHIRPVLTPYDFGGSSGGRILASGVHTYTNAYDMTDLSDFDIWPLKEVEGELVIDHAETELVWPVNSREGLEYAPALNRAETQLFFTLQNMRWNILPLPVIMVARRPNTSAPYGRAQRVMAIEGGAESPALSHDERSLYYHLKVDDRYEIWRVTR